ncbi:MAG: hypothetical protein HZA61_08170 [Candidatus Eisenbacteria bacterium]|uniref:Lipoprotein n=1 Tax=Eiseniibacteriota bacterium TaxID=2212470 RepID=A0A933SCA0_UNCEI|nr:hypothetical protein [Candidatus Eisenbacteria bacterium]
MDTPRPRLSRVLASALCALALAGCSTSSSVAPGANPQPAANSPVNLVRRIEWDWNQRSDDYVRLLTADFLYVPADGDSAGNAGRIWNREAESFVAQSMFARSGVWPQMNSLAFQLEGGELIESPDPRPGKHPRWHKVVSSNAEVAANLTLEGSTPEVYLLAGRFTFYCVRGDSAWIPLDLQWEGVTPDSTRWWIERWEDATTAATEPGMHPDPARTTTFTGLKNLFLPIR